MQHPAAPAVHQQTPAVNLGCTVIKVLGPATVTEYVTVTGVTAQPVVGYNG